MHMSRKLLCIFLCFNNIQCLLSFYTCADMKQQKKLDLTVHMFQIKGNIQLISGSSISHNAVYTSTRIISINPITISLLVFMFTCSLTVCNQKSPSYS